ncbi:DUF262 domain-containing protein [Pseudomonas chlororaphis]|uniref:DUF262 domain-containing protein n=1 Tax=Pseudomonas chlororaphis TaxID=587753 RepID=UPI0039E39F7A
MAKTFMMNITLIDLLHKIENRIILTPSFNRGFVWSNSQIKSLFESIYLGYPIGMILAVSGEAFDFETSPPHSSHFPEGDKYIDLPSQTLWIIDGSQRLAALYGVLRKSSLDTNIYFDLTNKEFTLKPNQKNKNATIKMSELFDYRAFMKVQEKLFLEKTFEESLHNLNDLHKKFQEYQIPVQVIMETDKNEAIEIFSRLNIFGSSLKKDELKKAKSYKKL